MACPFSKPGWSILFRKWFSSTSEQALDLEHTSALSELRSFFFKAPIFSAILNILMERRSKLKCSVFFTAMEEPCFLSWTEKYPLLVFAASNYVLSPKNNYWFQTPSSYKSKRGFCVSYKVFSRGRTWPAAFFSYAFFHTDHFGNAAARATLEESFLKATRFQEFKPCNMKEQLKVSKNRQQQSLTQSGPNI